MKQIQKILLFFVVGVCFLGGFLGLSVPKVQAEFSSVPIDDTASFNSAGPGEIVVDAEGGQYLAGSFTTVNGESKTNIVRLLSDGSIDPDFTASIDDGSPDSMTLAHDGSVLYVGGDFTTVNGGTTRNGIVAFNPATGAVTSFDPNITQVNGNVRELLLTSDDSLLYAAGDFTTVNGATTRNRVAAFSTSTGTATSFDPNMNQQAHSLALSSDEATLYVGGFFTSVNGGTTRNKLAAFSTSTGTATSFNPNIGGTTIVYDLILTANDATLYAVGSFTTVNGSTTRNRIAAFSTSTGTATSFNPNLNAQSRGIALLSDESTLYVAGAFSTVNGGTSRNGLTAFDTSTGTTTSFDPNINNEPSGLALSSSEGNLYVVGFFSTVNGGTLTRNRFAMFGDPFPGPSPSPSPSSSPQISLTNTANDIGGSRYRFFGTASTTSPFTVMTVEYSVNGGGNVNGVAVDGAFDESSEDFYIDVNPSANNNQFDGYVVTVNTTDTNLTVSQRAIYIQPFRLNSPANNANVSSQLPTFSFSVNQQHSLIENNVTKYRILVRKTTGEWRTYLDNIPVTGSSAFDNNFMHVEFADNSSTLTVTPKAVDGSGNSSNTSFDDGGMLLTDGIYQWKVALSDHANHTQESTTWQFIYGAGSGVAAFPLQINFISGVGFVNISSINPGSTQGQYTTISANPYLTGIAPVGTTITLTLTNLNCTGGTCQVTVSATSDGSSNFRLDLPSRSLISGNTYQVAITAVSGSDQVTLQPFNLILGSPAASPTPEATTSGGTTPEGLDIPLTPFSLMTPIPEEVVRSAPLSAESFLAGQIAGLENIGQFLSDAFSSPEAFIALIGKPIADAAVTLSHVTAPVTQAILPFLLVATVPATQAVMLVPTLMNTSLSWTIVIRILQALGLLPSGTPKGVIYDVTTNVPVPFAILTVESVDKTGSPVYETLVSDVNGIYRGIVLPKGTYRVAVKQNEYRFPTQRPRPAYLSSKEFYKGEQFTVADTKETQFFLVPGDQVSGGDIVKMRKTVILPALETVKKLNRILFLPSATLSTILFLSQMTLINGLIVLLYGVMGAYKLLTALKKPTLKGTVTDQQGRPLTNAIVRLVEPEANQVLQIVRTDKKGSYSFFVPQGIYHLSTIKTGYSDPSEKMGSFTPINTRKQSEVAVRLMRVEG